MIVARQSRLSVVRTRQGTLRLDCDGTPVPGVSHIDVVDVPGRKAEIIVTFLGPFVTLETEMPSNHGEN